MRLLRRSSGRPASSNAARMHFVGPLERLRYLKSFGPLSGLPLDEVSLLAQNIREVAFRPGEVLWKESDRQDRCFVIVDGSVRMEGPGPEPPVVKAGQAIGILSLLAGERMSQSCRAETEVAAMEIGREVFWDILEDRFPIYHQVVQAVAAELLLYRQLIAEGTVLAGTLRPPPVPADRPIELVERLISMRKAGVFVKSSLEGVIRLARTFEEQRIPAGTVLWKLWEPSGFAHFLIQGTVRCVLPDGRVFRATSGYPLGNLESHAREPRWYTPTAETDLVTFRSQTEVFLDVLEDHFDMATEFLAALAGNVIRNRRGMDTPAERS